MDKYKSLLLKPKKLIGKAISPNVKASFLQSSFLKNDLRVLDVGCGNSSVLEVKKFLPECTYVGIDVTDLNQNNSSKLLMDEYKIIDSKNFHEAIREYGPNFDLVISAHNLEHCDEPLQTLSAMLSVIKHNGYIYVSFPSKKSISFPSRKGTLNYYDDETHKKHPPDFDKIVGLIKDSGFEIKYSAKEYKPLIGSFIGLLNEPFSRYKNQVLRGTWDYYGFQSIIQAKKLK